MLCVSVTNHSQSCVASVVLSQVTHVHVGEEVAGGDAADGLVDVHGCDLSGSSENPHGTALEHSLAHNSEYRVHDYSSSQC